MKSTWPATGHSSPTVSTKMITSRATSINGAACAHRIWRKPTWTRPAFTWPTDTTVLAGSVPAGTGLPALVAIHTSRQTAFFTARSDGDSIHRLWSIAHRCSLATGATGVDSTVTLARAS